MTRGDDILHDMIDVSKGDIITVVGAGGKTSFINYFAKHYRERLKVLLTTTTKIYVPNKSNYDQIYMIDNNENIKNRIDVGVTVCGKSINGENKILGLDNVDIEKIKHKFDLIIIEGDGSKRKRIKGWNENEPVVYECTNKTIGMLDITAFNMDINEVNIHRLNKFYELTKDKGDKINLTHLKDIVINPKGIFKNAKGEKILFINKVENIYYENLALDLIKLINIEKHEIKLCYGSIMKDYFKYID